MAALTPKHPSGCRRLRSWTEAGLDEQLRELALNCCDLLVAPDLADADADGAIITGTRYNPRKTLSIASGPSSEHGVANVAVTTLGDRF
ncbi:hypothetical protein ACN267_18830 [Micromonospora sp. WMMD734]|uniref:hypothetical protein n=1 Tax=Micromonospora sp. WMMD734 TaxID=3404129 RepID=UPI003B944C7E